LTSPVAGFMGGRQGLASEDGLWARAKSPLVESFGVGGAPREEELTRTDLSHLTSLATQPGPGRGKKRDHGFKLSADGRLIIREEEDGNKVEEEDGTKGRGLHRGTGALLA
jgi:hypothetical protein